MSDRADDFSYEVEYDCDLDSDVEAMADHDVPIHPIVAMQDAFQESIQEAVDGDQDGAITTRPDAETRRRDILDQPTYDPSWKSRWKQKPNARCHPIVKLMSQIIFGLHLLHQRQAKSDSAVVKILQVHLDEIDTFLEKTTEDFELAIKDIEERISCLNLPMTHRRLFQKMLQDKAFRTQLMEGNCKIEQIIERTSNARGAALLDLQKALETVDQLAQYLDSVRYDWPHDTPEQEAIYFAMKCNEGGWRGCLTELADQGYRLGSALLQLGTVINEMNRLAGAASRRNAENDLSKNPIGSSSEQHRRASRTRPISSDKINKPLPKAPDTALPTTKATSQKARSSSVPATKLDVRVSTPPKKLKKKAPLQLQAKSTDYLGETSNSAYSGEVPSTGRSEAVESVPMPIYIPGQSRPQSPSIQYERTAPSLNSYRPLSTINHYRPPSQQRPQSPQRCSPRQAPQLPGFAFQEPLLQQFATGSTAGTSEGTSADYAFPSPPLILQYPEVIDRTSHNENAGSAGVQTTEKRVSQTEGCTITDQGTPNNEMQIEHVIRAPSQQSSPKAAAPLSSPGPTGLRIQIPSDERTSTQDRRAAEHDYESGHEHDDSPEEPRQFSPGRGGDDAKTNSYGSDLSPDLCRSSSSKVDSAYALSSAKQVRSGSTSRTPSRLGLFPDTSMNTPPRTRQAGTSGSAYSPPRQHSITMTAPLQDHQSQPTVARKISRLFSRRKRESQAY